MNKYGLHCWDKPFGAFKGKKEIVQVQTKDYIEIRNVLKQFQTGYEKRDLQKVDEFIEELFINKENTYAVGTGTLELFLGIEQVKQLIRDDWQYWGDANIDWENARIDVRGDAAWFGVTGSVKYTFEDTIEKYNRHISALKSKAEETGLTAKQKITYMNWFLSLVYHQREDIKREYLWPMRLSGVMLKDSGKWKFVNLKFSVPRTNFPDERFENSKEFLENYNKRNAMVEGYRCNHITEDVKGLLRSLENELIGQKDITLDKVAEYFAVDSRPYIISPESQWYDGVEDIKEFFTEYGNLNLSLELEHAFALKSDSVTSVTVTGVLKQNLTEEELAQCALEELENLLQADIPSKEKLFAAHRSMAYVLKEGAMGTSYTCPIRINAVISEGSNGLVFQQLHFSYPFYWILEGKLDNIQ